MAVAKHNARVSEIASRLLERPMRHGLLHGLPLLSLVGIAVAGGGVAMRAHASPPVMPNAIASGVNKPGSNGNPIAGRMAMSMSMHSAPVFPYAAAGAGSAESPYPEKERTHAASTKEAALGGGMTPAVAATIRDLPALARRIVEEHPRVQSLRAEFRAARMEVDQARAVNGLRIMTFSDAGGTNSSVSSGTGANLGCGRAIRYMTGARVKRRWARRRPG